MCLAKEDSEKYALLFYGLQQLSQLCNMFKNCMCCKIAAAKVRLKCYVVTDSIRKAKKLFVYRSCLKYETNTTFHWALKRSILSQTV